MPRWITFDQQTFSLLRARLSQGAAIETFGRDAIDYALAKPGAVVALLPGGGADVQLAVFRGRPRRAIPQADPQRARQTAAPPAIAAPPLPAKAATRAGGFLGLIDEPVEEEEEQPQGKKSWWRRFWDE